MYKKLKEKLSKLFKRESKLEHYEKFLIKLEIKKNSLVHKDDEESRESINVINKLIEKLEKKIKKIINININ